MNNNKIIKIASLSLFSITAFFSFSCNSENKQNFDNPNVILILSDDHSVPHVGCYGKSNVIFNNITPNLDAFAKQSMRFDKAFTTAPQCSPSRTSIFTGQHPVGLGVTRFTQPASKEVKLFPEIMRENGYWTGLAGRHQHLDGRSRPLKHIEKIMEEEGMKNLDSRFDYFLYRDNTKGAELDKTPEKINSILDKVPAGKPFFLYYGFQQPHRGFGNDYEEIDPNKLVLPPDWPDLPEVRKDYARYLSDVRDMDRGVGHILKVLDDRKIADNTIVIFMGDNGEALLRGKGTLYLRGNHVPLIIRWPGKVESGSVSKSLVSGEDIAPTILDALELPIPEEMTGKSFLGALKQDSHYVEREYVFCERGWHWGPITRTDGFDLSRSITSVQYHFIYNALPKQEWVPVDMVNVKAWSDIVEANNRNALSSLHQRLYFQKERPIFELYDLKNDPYQLNNLAGKKEYEQIELILTQELDWWMVREHDFLPLPSHVKLIMK